jgi:hypothetical protein
VKPCIVVVGYQRFWGPCCFHLHVEIFWVVMPFNVVVGYQHFRGSRCHHLQVEVFWVVMPFSVVVTYQRFRGPCCFHLQVEVFWFMTPCSVTLGYQSEYGGSLDLWKVGILPQHYTASQRRRPWLEAALISFVRQILPYSEEKNC